MEMIQSFLGADGTNGLELVVITIALTVTLILIFWILRKIAGGGKPATRPTAIPASTASSSRLSVVDTARIDDARRLMIVSCDGAEHW